MEEVTAPADLEPSQRETQALFVGDSTTLFMDKQYRRKDGELVWGHVNASVLREADGSPMGTVAMVHDISERKLAEEKLRASEGRFRAFYENSPVAVLIWSPTVGCTPPIGPRAQCSAWRRSELIAKGRDAVINLEDSRLAAALGGRAQTGRFVGELTLRRKNGMAFPVEVSSQIYRGDDGELYTAMIVRDITERKQTEAALAQTEPTPPSPEDGSRRPTRRRHRPRLQQSSHRHHRQQRPGSWRRCSDDPNRQLVEDIKGGGWRAAGLTGQILAFSRRQMLKPEVVRLSEVVSRMSPCSRTLGENIQIEVPWRRT